MRGRRGGKRARRQETGGKGRREGNDAGDARPGIGSDVGKRKRARKSRNTRQRPACAKRSDLFSRILSFVSEHEHWHWPSVAAAGGGAVIPKVACATDPVFGVPCWANALERFRKNAANACPTCAPVKSQYATIKDMTSTLRSLVIHESVYSVLESLHQTLKPSQGDVGVKKCLNRLRKSSIFRMQAPARSASSANARPLAPPKPPPKAPLIFLETTSQDGRRRPGKSFLEISRTGSVVLMWPDCHGMHKGSSAAELGADRASDDFPLLLCCCQGTQQEMEEGESCQEICFVTCQCGHNIFEKVQCDFWNVYPLGSILHLRRQFASLSRVRDNVVARALLGGVGKHTVFTSDSSDESSSDAGSEKTRGRPSIMQTSAAATMGGPDVIDLTSDNEEIIPLHEEVGGEKHDQTPQALRLTTHEGLHESKILSGLNNSQLRAIQLSLHGANASSDPSPVVLIQGPPGTGKTRTLVALLRILRQRNKKALVCASTNQAVNVLLQGYAASFDEADNLHPSACLVGVEEALTVETRPFFVHLARDRMRRSLRCARDVLLGRSGCAGLDAWIAYNKMPARFLPLEIGEICGIISLAHSNSARPDARKRERSVGSLHALLDRRSAIKEVLSEEQRTEAVKFLISVESAIEKCTDSDLERAHMRSSRVVFSTLCCAGRASMRHLSHFDYLLVDEAAQPVEAETFIALALAPARVVLVGDPRQLTSTTSSPAAATAGYGRSLMSRLMDLAGHSFHMLDTQYRMHPHIAQWPSQQYYRGKLVNAPSLEERPSPLVPLCFIDCPDSAEKGGNNHSLSNVGEADTVISVLAALETTTLSIKVITFYRAQVSLIRRRIHEMWGNSPIMVDTVDSMQGGEADVIVLSFVRSKRNVGFVSDARRLNVSLTRAKKSLILVGNFEMLQSCASGDIRSLMAHLDSHRNVWHSRFRDPITLRPALFREENA